MVKNIPRKLLIHEVEIKGKTVKKVRVEPINTIVQSLEGVIVKSNHLLFLSYKYTKPFPEDLEVDDDVIFNGKVLRVEKIETLSTTKKHHLEVYLI